MPVLAGVGEADRLSVLHDVGKRHDLGDSRLLVGTRSDVDLELAEARGEVLLLARGQLLARKADHAMAAQRLDDGVDFAVFQPPGQVQAFHLRAEHPPGRDELHASIHLKADFLHDLLTRSEWSRFTIAGGVRPGANTPYQVVTW